MTVIIILLIIIILILAPGILGVSLLALTAVLQLLSTFIIPLSVGIIGLCLLSYLTRKPAFQKPVYLWTKAILNTLFILIIFGVLNYTGAYFVSYLFVFLSLFVTFMSSADLSTKNIDRERTEKIYERVKSIGYFRSVDSIGLYSNGVNISKHLCKLYDEKNLTNISENEMEKLIEDKKITPDYIREVLDRSYLLDDEKTKLEKPNFIYLVTSIFMGFFCLLFEMFSMTNLTREGASTFTLFLVFSPFLLLIPAIKEEGLRLFKNIKLKHWLILLVIIIAAVLSAMYLGSLDFNAIRMMRYDLPY